MLQVNEKLLVRWQEEYFHKISFDFLLYMYFTSFCCDFAVEGHDSCRIEVLSRCT